MTATLPDAELCFTIGQHGAHWVSNALAVIATVSALGGDLAVAGLALAELEGMSGRGARYTVKAGTGTALVIDESYNANAVSMAATFEVLGNEAANRHIAVLGEMGELGDASEELHRSLAGPLLAAKPDFVLLVGPAMRPLAEVLKGHVEMHHVTDAATAADQMLSIISPGDAVLVKGSNYVGMAAVVSALRNA